MKIKKLSQDELREILDRANNATKGPWTTINHQTLCCSIGCTPDGCVGHDTGHAYNVDGPHLLHYGEPVGETEQQEKESLLQADRDSKFIANSRQDIPDLLSSHEALELENRELRNALSGLHILVLGECPSILNEDSGGDYLMALEVERLLGLGGKLPECFICGQEVLHTKGVTGRFLSCSNHDCANHTTRFTVDQWVNHER